MEISEDIVIVGAGVAGLTTSLGLHRLGLKSLVLESSESLRVSGYGIVISANAWRALDAVGVGDALRQHHQLLQGVQLIPMSRDVPSATIPLRGQGTCGRREVRCMKRKSLLETLNSKLPPGTVRLSSKVVSIQESGFLKLLHLADGSIIKAKVLIGCDGVNSVVAKWLGLSPVVSTQSFSIRGLAEFPDGHGLDPMILLRNGLRIRFGCIPCDETRVYWFLMFGSSAGKDDLKNNPTRIKQFVVDMLGSLPKQMEVMIKNTELNNLSATSIKARRPLDVLSGKIQKDNVCVAGDAFHPMTPDIGQGACSALEDAVVLARCLAEALKKSSDDQTEEEERHERINEALEKYAKLRQWRSFLITTTSYLTGKLQQSTGLVIRFLRDVILLRILMVAQLKIADFDCGKLHCA